MLQCSLIDKLSDKDKQILYSITNGVMTNDHVYSMLLIGLHMRVTGHILATYISWKKFVVSDWK